MEGFSMKMHKTGSIERKQMYEGQYYSLCQKTTRPEYQTDDDDRVECKLCLDIINNLKKNEEEKE